MFLFGAGLEASRDNQPVAEAGCACGQQAGQYATGHCDLGAASILASVASAIMVVACIMSCFVRLKPVTYE